MRCDRPFMNLKIWITVGINEVAFAGIPICRESTGLLNPDVAAKVNGKSVLASPVLAAGYLLQLRASLCRLE